MTVLGYLLIVLGGLLSLVSTVLLLIAAFRENILWGLAVLFIPFAALVFLVLHWAEAKRSFFIFLASVPFVAGGLACLVASAAQSFTAQMSVSGGNPAARQVADSTQTANVADSVVTETVEPATPAPATVVKPTPPPTVPLPNARSSRVPAKLEPPEPVLTASVAPAPPAPPVTVSVLKIGESTEPLKKLRLQIQNRSSQSIRDMKLTLAYYNQAGDLVKNWTTLIADPGGIVSALSTQEVIHPAYFMPSYAKTVTVKLHRVGFTDGTDWTP